MRLVGANSSLPEQSLGRQLKAKSKWLMERVVAMPTTVAPAVSFPTYFDAVSFPMLSMIFWAIVQAMSHRRSRLDCARHVHFHRSVACIFVYARPWLTFSFPQSTGLSRTLISSPTGTRCDFFTPLELRGGIHICKLLDGLKLSSTPCTPKQQSTACPRTNSIHAFAMPCEAHNPLLVAIFCSELRA